MLRVPTLVLADSVAPKRPKSSATRRDPSTGDPAHDVLVALRRIIRAVDLQSKRVSKASGLTTPQVLILKSIKELGEVTTGRVSSQVNLSQGTVTTILDRLEQRGLIERYRSNKDRRIVHTRLTKMGELSLDRAPPLLHEKFVAAFASLSAAEQTNIMRTLEDVAELLGGGELDAAPLLDVKAPVEPNE